MGGLFLVYRPRALLPPRALQLDRPSAEMDGQRRRNLLAVIQQAAEQAAAEQARAEREEAGQARASAPTHAQTREEDGPGDVAVQAEATEAASLRSKVWRLAARASQTAAPRLDAPAAPADSGGAAPMEIDGAPQAADASDTEGRLADAASAGGAVPAQTTESDASYCIEDMPVAAYQPIETNVLQPLEHAGEDGDTEAAGGGARMQRGRRPNQRARQQAKKKAAQEAAPQPAAGDGDSGVGQ